MAINPVLACRPAFGAGSSNRRVCSMETWLKRRFPGVSGSLAANADLSGAIHSSVAGDIHMSLARSLTGTGDARPTPPQLDKAHKALLDSLEEAPLPELAATIPDFRLRAAKRVGTVRLGTAIEDG